MKKLSKEDVAARDVLIERFNATFAKLSEVVDQYNENLANGWGAVEEAAASYNEVISDATEWTTGIAGQIDEYMSERSDKWREGEKGDAFATWKQEFEGAESALQEVDLSQPDEVTIDVENGADTLENLPEEIES